MQFPDSPVETNLLTSTIHGLDRWQIYQRLQELSIPSQCRPSQPLQVQVEDVATAIQLWSVTRQLTASRQELIHWLEVCWQIEDNP